jgi:cation diffusion facilitator family transporter
MSITIQDSGEHCHDDEHRHEIDKKARKKLWIASILCVVFMIGETIGGYFAGSLAIASDAAHLLTDFASFMISLFALYISERPATKRLSYGYHRAEVIGALTSVLLIWVVTGILVYMAVQRVITQEFEIDAQIMLITSGIGLIVNVIMGCTLHQHSHSHGGGGGHNHSHDSHGPKTTHNGHGNGRVPAPKSNGGYVSTEDVENGNHHHHEESDSSSSSAQVSVEKPNLNVRAAFIHVIGDFLQSLGVFLAAIAIYFQPSWVIVDPICTFLFSVLVLGTTYAIIRDALLVLMEGIPKGLDFNEVRETLLEVKGVCKVHNLRIWSLSMDKIAMSAHLAIEPNGSFNSSTILKKSSQLVKTKYGFCEVTIQIEDFSEGMQDCVKCQELNY